MVGRSGSGKSTLVGLLLRFMDPDAGVISANGVPIGDLPAGAWREHVALVPQRPHLFYGSVLENIRLARPEASRAEVERAAELAGAAEFIRRMPQGYDTQIGERGLRLSGGEAQRLAIARAFLKDAPLLVMDEPTSCLDPESERLIRDALDRLARGRTSLIVAHRLNTVSTADRIVVLHEGRVAETGTHAGLLDTQRALLAPGGRLRGRAGVRVFLRLLGFLRPYRWRVVLGVLLGVATVASNVGLLATAAYVISAAAVVPFLAMLTIPVYLVRLFSVSRAASRYAERLVSHDVTFRLLAELRTRFYTRLAPLAPARLLQYRSGDLLSRIVKDVEELQNVYLRSFSPVAVALAVCALAALVLCTFDPAMAFVALGFLAATGVGVPAAGADALQRAGTAAAAAAGGARRQDRGRRAGGAGRPRFRPGRREHGTKSPP